MNETIRQLIERRSVRSFTDKPISPDDRELILTAAAMAPTAGNQQLYTILDVTDPELRQRLAESCDHQPFITKAAMVLVFCADCLKWYRAYQEAGCTPRKPGAGDLLLAVDDALIAAQNAVTAAQSLGIGSCYVGDIMENCELQREILGLPDYVFPAALLVFGYPTEQQKERPKPLRSPLRCIVQENCYREPDAEQLRNMLLPKCGGTDYEEWVRAFCKRKYASDFSHEMTRSVRKLLEQYE